MKIVQIKVNKPVPPFIKGQIVPVETDKNGTPLLKFWRDRLKDAETDNCIEIVKKQTKTASSKED